MPFAAAIADLRELASERGEPVVVEAAKLDSLCQMYEGDYEEYVETGKVHPIADYTVPDKPKWVIVVCPNEDDELSAPSGYRIGRPPGTHRGE